ncbi:PREDICTED: phosphoglycolate phosphatase 2-like [Nicrophorus vespilloides]|uniref:Phosphoglycolate phosphatase 2-like n=1 Tax=Nicrophorus vespilloides TaxID=110193 RepID=A0ABM1MVI1_NICVS|nr:PREDICTED: phosphoglycolate phosphatase 2-like [Nicrophorus vespilloides]
MVITKPKDLANASQDEVKTFIESFDNIYFDCDGVLMHGVNLIPGVSDTVKILRDLNKNMKIITNNTFRSSAQWNELLMQNRMNFCYDDIVSPTKVVIDYLKKLNFNKKIYVLGTKIFKEALIEAGFDILEFDGEMIFDIDACLDNITDNLDVGAVIVEFDFNLNYSKLLKATMLLNRHDVHFLCCGLDKKYYIKNKMNVLGSFYCINGLETVTNRKPLVCGKPGPLLQSFLASNIGFDPARTLFVGDSMDSDIKFAQFCGFQQLLVFTGITKTSDLEKGFYSELPKYCMDSLGHLHKLIESIK